MVPEYAQELADAIYAAGFTDWDVAYSGGEVICPCGYEVEADGECPSGCVSPLLLMGLV